MTNYIKINDLANNETKTSPFAVYPGERISIREVPSPRHMYITDVDKVILVFINKYLVLSSKLLLQALRNAKMEIDQKDLQKRLHMLTDAAYLQSARFTNADGTYAAGMVYSVGYRGRGYLKSINVQPKLGGYVAQLDSSSVKRYLSVNQYLINTGKDYGVTEVGHTLLVPEPRKDRPDKIFRAYGMVQEEDKTVIVDAVRKDVDKEYLLERLERMNDTISHRNCNTQVHKTVELVLIAESCEHLKEVNSWLKGKHFSKLSICLSTDTLTNNQPECCLVEREKSTGFFRSLFTAACY